MILIDAARSGKAPGTVHRLDASASPIGGQVFPRSSHAIGVSEAIELARASDVLPSYRHRVRSRGRAYGSRTTVVASSGRGVGSSRETDHPGM